MTTIDALVIGAGVTGLASARALARAGRSVCVLERHPRPGLDTSTHNSGVVHAGLYYAPGSFKARMSVAGNRSIVDFARANGVTQVFLPRPPRPTRRQRRSQKTRHQQNPS